MALTDLQELKRNLRLILSQVHTGLSIYATADTLRLVIGDGAPGKRFAFEPPRPGDEKLTNEQLPLIRLLNADTAPALRSQFVECLLAEITDANALVVIHAVLEIGALDDIKQWLDGLSNRYGLRQSVWLAILDKLLMEPQRFTDRDLGIMRAMTTEEEQRVNRFRSWRASERRKNLPPPP